MELERVFSHLSLLTSKQCVFDKPVIGPVSTGLVNLDNDEDVLKMRPDGLGSEGQGAGLLKHDCHDVITDVSLP